MERIVVYFPKLNSTPESDFQHKTLDQNSLTSFFAGPFQERSKMCNI